MMSVDLRILEKQSRLLGLTFACCFSLYLLGVCASEMWDVGKMDDGTNVYPLTVIQLNKTANIHGKSPTLYNVVLKCFDIAWYVALL